MPLARDNGRLRVRVAKVDFTFASTDDAGVAIGLVGAHLITSFDMPSGAMVVGGAAHITTAFTDAGETTLTVGDVTTAARYLTVTDVFEPVGQYLLIPTGFIITNTQPTIRMTMTVATSANTAGVGSLWIQYVVRSVRSATPSQFGG